MLQDARASASDPAVICSFDYEAIDKPTRAIIHQAARFLYVKRGRGKLVIDGEEYVLSAGDSIVMPAGHPHSVYGKERFKMLLTVVF